MKGNLSEKLKNLFNKKGEGGGVPSILKGLIPVIPAICLCVLVVSVLAGYKAPEAEKYNASASEDVSQIKEALASQTSSNAASGTTAAKKTTKKVGKGSFDVKDGEYQGSANGYGGKVTVKVTVKDKTMQSIDIVSAPGETDSFFSRAKGVIDEMLSAQSVDVDVVSGATYSSNGIIGAVKNALYGTESASSTAAAASATSGSAPNVSTVKESGTWKDGTYTGSGKGFGGNISVEVTVKDGKISKINVTSAPGEGSSYLSKAKGLISTMISKQTTNVDAASGATYSSNGLIKAVRNALSKAETKSSTKKNKKKKKKKKNKKKSTEKKKTVTPDPGKTVPYVDGTFDGSAEGFGGTVKVSVTIKDGQITKITATGDDETPSFFTKAKALLDNIIKNQTADVDVVSGATYSSNGLINAVKAALQKAKTATDKASTAKKEETTTAKKEETTTEKKEDTDASETTTETKPDETTTEEEEGTVYKNGTFSGTATCYPDDDEDFSEYKVTVTVKISKDTITSVEASAQTNALNRGYLKDALNGVSGKIKSQGNADGIDAVSHATCSSKAILEAAKAALDSAKK